MKQLVVLFNSIIVPLLKGHPFSNDKVASLEEDNLLVLYYAHVSIWNLQWLAAGQWFSQGIPVSSTNKTDRHDITEILLNTITHTHTHWNLAW
jgi:hypothetical protein